MLALLIDRQNYYIILDRLKETAPESLGPANRTGILEMSAVLIQDISETERDTIAITMLIDIKRESECERDIESSFRNMAEA